jgi:hypothetical protein
MRQERRDPWYMLTGFILGTLMGVLYAWLVSPIAYTDTPPAALRADFKDQYRTLIALAYASNGDLGRAKARLALLDETDTGSYLAEQVQLAADGRRPVSEIQAMILLAEALGVDIQPPELTPTAAPSDTPSPSPTATATTPNSPAPSETPDEAVSEPTAGTQVTSAGTPPPEESPTPSQTSPALPTPQPTATTGAPFVLRERQFLCEPALTRPLIQVEVFDSAGQPVPGMGIFISWDGGQDRFFTGLKPERGLGYADFEMIPGISYTLRLSDGGQLVSDLRTSECTATGGGQFWGSLYLRFAQP